jgi:iron-sulfur cluster protein
MDKSFRTKIKEAIYNTDLQKGLKKAIKNFQTHRQQALKDVNYHSVQEEISALRLKNLDKLERLIITFKDSCQNNNIPVYEVHDSKEARQKIYEILQNHHCKKLVKAKSMVSEEIELNNFLDFHGIQAIETDLGEWLVQLAGEKPSHITAPALHMTKEQVAELVNRKFNESLPADATAITKFARKTLRKEFIEADAGLTGANILVAESGSIVIVSNEGNARLVSTLPSVHIVLATPEKLVENMQEAEKILHILPKSSTGQQITSYISIISGPSKTADIQKELVEGVHGPENVYVVLLDNGRLSLLKDPEFREVLKCIKCGACLGMCPVYQSVGGHVYGKTHMGGLGAILTAMLETLPESQNMVELCAGCGICKNICPANVDIPGMILKLKEKLNAENLSSETKEFIVKNLFTSKTFFDTILKSSGLFQNIVFSGHKEIEKLPWKLSNLTKFRNLPVFASKSLSKRIKKEQVIKPFDPQKQTLAFFGGCLVEHIYPEAGLKTIRLLQNLSYNVAYPNEQTCCGIPALYAGEVERYKKFLQENRNFFNEYKNKNLKGIITICPSCTQGLSRETFVEGVEIFDLTEFLYKIHKYTSLNVRPLKKVTYHPSCHARKDEGYATYSHKLLRDLYPDNFVEYFDMYSCCGAAGSYAIENPEISEKIIERKINNILESDANNVIIDCPGCLMQFQGYIQRHSLDLNTIFITDIFQLESSS